MKRCPICRYGYADEIVKFCRYDGAPLIGDSPTSDSPDTLILPAPPRSAETRTQLLQDTPSIAVLPFVHMSADADNEYFCDGLAEELLNALAQVEGLKVAARTSAFSFKDKNVEVGEVGKALRVRTVLEGSVRRAGSRLRITVQLVNVADGYHLWSERYDREMKDIFDVQDEITLAVVEALKVKLLGEEKSAVLRRHTDDPEAYELYLKGRYYLHKHTPEGWQRALEFFDQAIEKEPEYAPAHAGKANGLALLLYYSDAPPQEAIRKWEAAANRALASDGGLAEARLAKAGIHFYHEWDWAAAEREYKQAIRLSPSSADARQYYALFLASRGRFGQAIGEGRKALELDPLSLPTNLNVGWTYWFANQWEDTLAQGRKLAELEPNYFGAHWLLGALYWAQGNYEEAIRAHQKSLSLNRNLVALGMLGALYGIVGKRDEAQGVLSQLLEMRERQNVAFHIARVYSGLGVNDKALEWLERAVAKRNMELVFLETETKVGAGGVTGKSITDPRITELLRRAGLISS